MAMVLVRVFWRMSARSLGPRMSRRMVLAGGCSEEEEEEEEEEGKERAMVMGAGGPGPGAM